MPIAIDPKRKALGRGLETLLPTKKPAIIPSVQARAYERLGREFSLTQEEMARRTGKERASVANFLRLLKLPEPVQQKVAGGELTFGHAKVLLMLDSPEAISKASQKVMQLS